MLFPGFLNFRMRACTRRTAAAGETIRSSPASTRAVSRPFSPTTIASRISRGIRTRPSEAIFNGCGSTSRNPSEGARTSAFRGVSRCCFQYWYCVPAVFLLPFSPTYRSMTSRRSARRPFSRVISSAISQTRPVRVPGSGRARTSGRSDVVFNMSVSEFTAVPTKLMERTRKLLFRTFCHLRAATGPASVRSGAPLASATRIPRRSPLAIRIRADGAGSVCPGSRCPGTWPARIPCELRGSWCMGTRRDGARSSRERSTRLRIDGTRGREYPRVCGRANGISDRGRGEPRGAQLRVQCLCF